LKALVILPTYNEKENIEIVVNEILSAHKDLDILIIDDNSPDGTGEIADGIAQKESRVKVHHRPGKLGYGKAYLTGFKMTLSEGYDYYFQMDSDLSHDPKEIPAILEKMSRHDMVIGSRYVPGGKIVGWGPIRYIISMGGNLFARTMLRLPVKDCTSGYRCYKAKVLKELKLEEVKAEGYGFQVEILYRVLRGGFNVGEHPIIFADRELGKSKMSKSIAIEAFKRVLSLRKEGTIGKNN